jgi:hypothetical protein
MTIAEIKSAIEDLSEKERCELSAWLQAWAPDQWDIQMQADVEAGKLDSLASEAEAEFKRKKRDSHLFPRTQLKTPIDQGNR